MKVITRATDLLLFCGLWALIRALPFLMTEGYTAEFELHHRFEGGVTLIALAMLVPILWMVEAICFLQIYSLIRVVKKILFRRLLTTLYSIALICYFSAHAISWTVYHRTGFFSGIDSLQLADFAFFDVRVLLSNVSESDLWRFMILPVVATIPVLILLLAHRLCSYSLLRAKPLLGTALLLLALVFLPAAHLNRLPEKRIRFFQSLLFNFVSPDLSLVWAPLWLNSPVPGFERVALELMPVKADGTYLASIKIPPAKNILLLTIEALRADILAAYGGVDSVMPFVDKLSKESIVFERAYAQGAETAYSQTTIASSLYPLKFPFRDVGKDIDYPSARVYDILSDLGYHTAYLTEEWTSTSRFTRTEKIDLYLNPAVLSKAELQTYLPDKHIFTDSAGVPTAATTDRVNIAALSSWLGSISSNEPFFASLYLFASHYPFNPPKDFAPVFKPFVLGDAASEVSFLGYPEKYAAIMKNRYKNTLRYIDNSIRALFKTLSENGQLENTIVILTGDHGSYFHEHGLVNHAGHLYEEVARVPLLFYGVENKYPIDDARSPVGHIDITPTVLGLLDLPPHPNHQGEALLFSEPPENSLFARPLFSTVQLVVQEDCVLRWPWKYCYNRRENSERLFNLIADPAEQVNQAAKPEARARSNALSRLLQTFRNRQLSYYAPDSNYRSTHYPPKIDY